MLAALAIVAAVAIIAIDWWAVALGRTRVEEFAKPLVMVSLIAVALAIDSGSDEVLFWLVAALAFGLIGDVFLLPRINNFIAGLASFLVGHLLYVVALARLGLDLKLVFVGLLVGAAVLGTVARRVVNGVADTPLFTPVLAYNLVIVVMVVLAFGTGEPLAIAGGLAFAASDALIGLDRFVWSDASHRIQIMVLYHLGQVGLLVGIAAPFGL